MAHTVPLALANQDVWYEIFSWLDPLNSTQQNEYLEAMRTLRRSARVCKQLHHPAVRTLWYSLEDVWPLLRLFPSFGRVEGCVGDDDVSQDAEVEVYSISEDITPQIWERFALHAACVQTLWASGLGWAHRNEKWIRVTLDEKVWNQLDRASLGRPLLPNLRFISWSITDSAPRAMLRFMPPSIQEVRLISGFSHYGDSLHIRRSRQAVWRVLLPLLAAYADQVSGLELYLGEVPLSLILPSVSAMRSVRSLKIGASNRAEMEQTDVHQLALMDGLERLEFLNAFGRELGGPPAAVMFKGLTSLFFQIDRGGYGPLDCISSHALGDLVVDHCKYVNSRDCQQRFAVWASCFPNLRNFQCRLDDLFAADHPCDHLTYAIAPLLGLRSLESVKIAFTVKPALFVDDKDILAMANAWPSLLTFSLHIFHPLEWCSAERFRPSTASLAALASGCPRLRRVFLTRIVDDFSLPEAEEIVYGHPLHELIVREQDVNDKDRFKELLGRMFPHANVSTWLPPGSDVCPYP